MSPSSSPGCQSGVVEIREPADLARLFRPVLTPPRGPRRVSLLVADEHLPPARRREFERQLTRHSNACGCEVGAGLLVAGWTGYAIYLGLGGWSRFSSVASFIGSLMLASVALALVGKLAGLALARWRLQRSVRDLLRAWRPEPSHVGDSAAGASVLGDPDAA
jgi:hypothetical protein